jgi:transposase
MGQEPTTDARRLKSADRKKLAATIAYTRAKDPGITNQELAEQFGVHRTTVARWLKRQSQYGSDIFDSTVKGRKKSSPNHLTRRQLAYVVATLLTELPLQGGGRGGLWNKSRIESLILSEFDIDVPPDYVPRLLRQKGFPLQQPWHMPDATQYADLLTGQIVQSADHFLQTSPESQHRRFWVNQHTLDIAMQQALLTTLDEQAALFTKPLSRPRAVLCAHNPKGVLSFRCYTAPISSTAISGFLRLLNSEDPSPLSVIFGQPCALTQGGKKWLKSQAGAVKAMSVRPPSD